jgi:hypothetical protein
MSLAMMLILVSQALASDTLMIWDEKAAATTALLAWTDMTESTVDTVSLPLLLQRKEVFSTSDIGGCDANPNVPKNWTKLSENIDFARKSINNNKLRPAEVALDRSIAGLSCFGTAIDTQIVGEVYMLRGKLFAYTDRPAFATDAYRQALIYNPQVECSGCELALTTRFESAIESLNAEPTGQIEFLVHPGEGRLSVDGKPIARDNRVVPVSSGGHLLQVQEPDGSFRSYAINVGKQDKVTVVISSAVSEDVFSWTQNESQREDLSRLLKLIQPESTGPVYTYAFGELWRGYRNEAAWTRIDKDTPFADALPKRLVVGGSALALTGVSTAIYMLVKEAGYVEEADLLKEQGDHDGWNAVSAKVDSAYHVQLLGWGAAAVGSALAVYGFVLNGETVSVAPLLGATSGIALSVRY